jgi:hypothetical protein
MSVAPKVADAFRKGGGVTFGEFGAAGVEALDWINCGQRSCASSRVTLTDVEWLLSGLSDLQERRNP